MAAKKKTKKKKPVKKGSKIRVCRKVSGRKKKTCYWRKAHNKRTAKKRAKRPSLAAQGRKLFGKPTKPHALQARRRRARHNYCGC